jgi:hypothetical protein
MIMNSKPWFAEMPKLPLMVGVPVVWLFDNNTYSRGLIVEGEDGLKLRAGWAEYDVTLWDDIIRVDIDNPMGFAYAVQALLSSRGDDHGHHIRMSLIRNKAVQERNGVDQYHTPREMCDRYWSDLSTVRSWQKHARMSPSNQQRLIGLLKQVGFGEEVSHV